MVSQILFSSSYMPHVSSSVVSGISLIFVYLHVCLSHAVYESTIYRIAIFCQEDFNLAIGLICILKFVTVLSVTFYNSRGIDLIVSSDSLCTCVCKNVDY